ncbi:hypothetical protein D030_1196B, partial [Vibrio parahaemolyticus AQ3810]
SFHDLVECNAFTLRVRYDSFKAIVLTRFHPFPTIKTQYGLCFPRA